MFSQFPTTKTTFNFVLDVHDFQHTFENHKLRTEASILQSLTKLQEQLFPKQNTL